MAKEEKLSKNDENQNNEDKQSKYGEYFMNRTVADIMNEWTEWQGEWKDLNNK